MMKSIQKYVTTVAVGALAVAITPGDTGSAHAGKGAAFLGGMVTSHVVGGFVRRDRARTQMEAERTYRQPAPQPQYAAPPPRQAVAPARAQPAAKSVEQRMQELKSLASKGLITQQEYQARRKTIISGI